MWHKVSKISDIEEGQATLCDIGGQEIAVFKSGGGFYAMDGVCPHQGGPLHEGYVADGEVTCPWHAWAFDIKTGECQTVSGVQQKCFKTKIENEEVWIDVL